MLIRQNLLTWGLLESIIYIYLNQFYLSTEKANEHYGLA